MSECYYLLIPQDPQYMPAEDRIQLARSYWAQISPVHEGEVLSRDESPQIRNLDEIETVRCPSCRRTLSVGALAVFESENHCFWWQEALAMVEFAPDEVPEMPCCGSKTDVVALTNSCHPTPLFSRFSIGLREPNYEIFEGEHLDRLIPMHLEHFESILGCKLIERRQRA
jgi:hypothetical protein